MAEKTIVDKAGETVGVGIAMASDVAGAIKTAFGAAVTTVSEVLKKAPAKTVTARTTPQKKDLSRRPPKRRLQRRLLKKLQLRICRLRNP